MRRPFFFGDDFLLVLGFNALVARTQLLLFPDARPLVERLGLEAARRRRRHVDELIDMFDSLFDTAVVEEGLETIAKGFPAIEGSAAQ